MANGALQLREMPVSPLTPLLHPFIRIRHYQGSSVGCCYRKHNVLSDRGELDDVIISHIHARLIGRVFRHHAHALLQGSDVAFQHLRISLHSPTMIDCGAGSWNLDILNWLAKLVKLFIAGEQYDMLPIMAGIIFGFLLSFCSQIRLEMSIASFASRPFPKAGLFLNESQFIKPTHLFS